MKQNTLSYYHNDIKNCVPKGEIEKNLKLVIFLATQYCRKRQLFKMYEDLIQAGNLGLIRAIKKYNPNLGYKFSSYARWWIVRFMQKEWMSISNVLTIPNPDKTIRDSISGKCRLPSKIDMDQADFSALDNWYSFKENFYDIDYDLFTKQIKKELNDQILKVLTEKELTVIRKYYFDSKSLSQVGRDLGYTKQNINLIQKSALNKLKKDEEINRIYNVYKNFA